jgi:hypothetical protein
VTGSPPAPSRGLACSALPVGLVLLVVLTTWIGRVHEGRRALEDCNGAVARGDYVEAIVFARAAAEARCPSCSAPELGYSRLYGIAKDAEGRGEDAVAVAAWRAVRSATIGTAIFDISPARRERADAEIARLEHRIDVATAAAGGSPSPAATEERIRVALGANVVPSMLVFVLLALGGALFVVGAIRFVRARTFSVVELAVAAAGAGLGVASVLLF